MLSREEHNEFSKIAQFDGGMMKTTGNIALQNQQILYVIYNNCIVRGNYYHFSPENGTLSARNTNIQATKFAKLYFPHFTTFR